MKTRDEIVADATKANRLGIECWLSWQNRSDEIKLPVTPFPWLSKPKNNQVVNLYERGDVNLAGNLGLRAMTLESFLPHVGHKYSFLSTPYDDDPYATCRLIDKWFVSDYPIRVVFTGTNYDIAFMIDSFEYGEKDRTRDVYFKLDLSEYRFVDEATKATADATTAENAVAEAQKDLKNWTVKYGDTLSGISKAKFGNFDHVEDIIKWNKDLIKTPDSLKAIAGKELKLEEPPKQDDKKGKSETPN